MDNDDVFKTVGKLYVDFIRLQAVLQQFQNAVKTNEETIVQQRREIQTLKQDLARISVKNDITKED